MVVGRIRHQLKPSQGEDSSLTLNVSSADFIDLRNDSLTVFRIQTAWDTSLHHTRLLNMISATNMLVHATMSVCMEMENCTQPACFTINFSLQITDRLQKRAGSRLWDSLFPRNIVLRITAWWDYMKWHSKDRLRRTRGKETLSWRTSPYT